MERQKVNIPIIKFACFFFVLLLSCASKQSVTVNANKIEVIPKIIFLNYSIKKTSNGNRHVHFINKIVAEGKLKNHNKNREEELVAGDLKCHQLDKNSKVLQNTVIKNPLVQTIEYLDDSKSFQTKTIAVDSTNFSIRLQLEANTKYISISEIDTKQTNSKPLITTKLN